MMTRKTTSTFRLAIAVVVGAAALFISDQAPIGVDGIGTSTAEAIIGRPLTPMSYAGVARRTTARAVVPGAVVVAPVVVVAPRPGCWQVVNAYGQLIWRCP
ncbi:hypothetical protein [Kaistia terrae]|uniref:Uncharacterized protein n=1 Tax=Kaistia terrae TaxID=537017 RepID=A0ABW0Q4L5_9HYPH|nr:hypothetical protein [Kaistia terrae]MCX5581736.1 hypothetical protein [Kaistia terrae]